MTDHCLKVFDSNAGRNRNYECVFDPFFAGFDGFSKLLRLDCKNNGIDLRKPRTGFLMSMDTVFGRKTLQFLFIVINDVNIIALPVT